MEIGLILILIGKDIIIGKISLRRMWKSGVIDERLNSFGGIIKVNDNLVGNTLGNAQGTFGNKGVGFSNGGALNLFGHH